MKKLIALVLALAMVAMIGLAFAEQPTNYAVDDPAASYQGDTQFDTTFTGEKDGNIYVRGLLPGDVVYFYKVIEVDPDASAKLTDTLTEAKAAGWAVTSAFSSVVNAEMFKTILTTGIKDDVAGAIGGLATGRNEGDYAYKATVAAATDYVKIENPAAGLYVAIVVPADAGWMFNPVFVAADYYSTTGGDKSSDWTVDIDLSYSNSAMAKKAPITVTKEATEYNEDTYETNGNNDAKAVAVGDQIDFTVTTTIPEFADNYTRPLFIVNDKMTNGLNLVTGSVKVYDKTGTTEIANTWDDNGTTKTSYTITPGTHEYKIVFDPGYLLSLTEATKIIVKYSATVTEAAVTNVNEEDNTVTIEYSHEPSVDDEGEGKKVGDKTHHYSFTIDGNIWGSKEGRRTEVVKVGVDKDGNEITVTKTIDNGKEVGALRGAEFKLYVNEGCTTEYNKEPYKNAKKIVSDEYGRLNIDITGHHGISGLDAGTYYLKETKAPDGYIKDQTPTKIEITPTYYGPVTWIEDGVEVTSDDILKSYTVKIDGVVTATYTLNYTMNGEGTLPINDDTTETDNMKTTAVITISNSGMITTGTGAEASDDDGKIVNTQGVELPSTGGIGTTLFYVIGGLLVIGAAVVLVARRKAHE